MTWILKSPKWFLTIYLWFSYKCKVLLRKNKKGPSRKNIKNKGYLIIRIVITTLFTAAHTISRTTDAWLDLKFSTAQIHIPIPNRKSFKFFLNLTFLLSDKLWADSTTQNTLKYLTTYSANLPIQSKYLGYLKKNLIGCP